jgi:hypothetical protein
MALIISREHVLSEIRRLAEESNGTPPGRKRFASETGIREADWAGRYWARWSDAVLEAGFEPNKLKVRYEDDAILPQLIEEIRRLGRMPTKHELRLRRREDVSFPSDGVFDRLGTKKTLAGKVANYCRDRPDLADVLAIIEPFIAVAESESVSGREDAVEFGFVYLLKSGRHYKLGRTNAYGRRERELTIQLPERVTRVHVIKTDDPVGIEGYWHQRFADRRRNGEWFELTSADIAAFRRRKFM